MTHQVGFAYYKLAMEAGGHAQGPGALSNVNPILDFARRRINTFDPSILACRVEKERSRGICDGGYIFGHRNEATPDAPDMVPQ